VPWSESKQVFLPLFLQHLCLFVCVRTAHQACWIVQKPAGLGAPLPSPSEGPTAGRFDPFCSMGSLELALDICVESIMPKHICGHVLGDATCGTASSLSTLSGWRGSKNWYGRKV